MKSIRRKIATFFTRRALSLLLYSLIRLIRLTMRIKVIGKDVMPSLVRRGEGFAAIFWHGRMLMIPFFYPGSAMHVLISTHRDGEIIANVMKCFGFGLVRGSSTRGGSAALREMVHLLKRNKDLGITPDGPKGPVEVVKQGTAHVAKLSGKAVVPMAFAASRATRMRSWDGFLIPHPFSRGVFVAGDPLYYREGEDLEQFRQRIEAALKQTTALADQHFTARQ